MRYLCMGYYDPARFDELSEAEREAVAAVCAPHDQAFRDSGSVAMEGSLGHGVHVTLRPTGSGTSVTDGPYTESKELVGSFFIIEAESLDEAVRIASLHPAARVRADLGFGIEVRPIEILAEVSPESGGLRIVEGTGYPGNDGA